CFLKMGHRVGNSLLRAARAFSVLAISQVTGKLSGSKPPRVHSPTLCQAFPAGKLKHHWSEKVVKNCVSAWPGLLRNKRDPWQADQGSAAERRSPPHKAA